MLAISSLRKILRGAINNLAFTCVFFNLEKAFNTASSSPLCVLPAKNIP